MKRVVYIESHPNYGVWEKLVEMEYDKIVFETPWKPSLMSNSVKTPYTNCQNKEIVQIDECGVAKQDNSYC